MTQIPLPPGALKNPLVIDVGVLTSLLVASGTDLAFDLDWFQDPIANLKAIIGSGKRADMMKLLRDVLPAVAPTAPDGRTWYPLNKGGVETGLYIVLPADDTGSTSIIGLGLWKTHTSKTVTIDAWTYIPLFQLPITTNPVVTGSTTSPIEVAIRVRNSTPFTAGPVSFTGLQYSGKIVFGGNPSFELDFTDFTGGTSPGVVTNIKDLINAPASAWVNAVLASPDVTGWLAKNVGSSGITIGNVFSAIGVLSAPASTGGSFTLADLSALTSLTPLQIAEKLLGAALSLLASNTNPLVIVAGGGIWVTSEDAGAGAKRYGLKLQVPDIDVSPSDANLPRAKVQIGSLLTNDGSTSWMSRGDSERSFGDPGVIVNLVTVTTDGAKSVPSFTPIVELNSIGIDLSGANSTPLVNVNGVTLGGFEARFFTSLDFSNLSAIPWGAAIRCDDFGLPLANGVAGSTGSNAVAQSLLSTGGGSGDSSAVNPTFSAAMCKIVDPANATTVQFWADLPEGGTGDEVWLPIQRAFGPLMCKRLGISWPEDNPDDSLWFLFDGSVTLGNLGIDLMGLSLGLPLHSVGDVGTYHLALQGLSINYEAGPLAITGGLMETHTTVAGQDILSYDGQALIKAENWTVSALGSYASMNGEPSLFIFAFLEATLGGPPVFFVTGLSAGFGYNRSLRIPGLTEIPSFPLVAGITDPSVIGGEGASPATALAALGNWVQPAQGQNWFAAGVQFTSFELVNSNVLVVVQPSSDFEINILGLSRIKFPQSGALTFGYAELMIKATISPAQGTFMCTAVLSSNSYILDEACHLTGGFAFGMWFGDQHNGDFVITLGGYHPAFVKPDWYPDVPRLGFSWQVSSNVSIQGGAYFALTPSCVMGGGSLDVEFHSGDLHAWFTAYADFLLHWKPFYYTGSVGVSIGASYKLDLLFTSVTVSVELGASLDIWGPPTGGIVHIDWYIISFSVSFGADREDTTVPIAYTDFRSLLPQNKTTVSGTRAERKVAESPAMRMMSMDRHDSVVAQSAHALRSASEVGKGLLLVDDLPPLTNVCKITITDGLSSTVTTAGVERWLVRADEITLAVESSFPATTVTLAGPTPSTISSAYTSISVRPMAATGVPSAMTVTLTYEDGSIVSLGSEWTFGQTTRDLPEAMWGSPMQPGVAPAPAANTIPDLLVGVGDLTPIPPMPSGPPAMQQSALAHATIDPDNSNWLPLNAAASPVTAAPTIAPTSIATIIATVNSDAVKQTRGDLFAALASLGYNAGANDDMQPLAATAGYSYPAPPMLWSNS